MTTIVPVVEGDGEVAALPGLLGRILLEKYNRSDVLVAQGKSMVVNANGRSTLENRLEKFIRYAQYKPDCGAILVLLDTDGECPVALAQELLQRCEKLGLTCPIEIVCAHRSYESWFLASLDTIKGQRGISDTGSIGPRSRGYTEP